MKKVEEKFKNKKEKEMFFARPTLPFALLLLFGGVLGAYEVRIHNAEELINFSKSVSSGTSYSGSTVYLDSDIDFTPLSREFQPIGKNETLSFQGIFDGQGHIISNLALNLSSVYVGLFGYTAGATIKNVVLDDSCSFTNSYSSSNPTIGSISGYCASCAIESIVNMESVAYIGSGSNFCVGGIVGRLTDLSTIKNCVNYGTVTYSGNSTGDGQIGGITGMCAGSGTKSIQNCANYGAITNNGESEDLYMGGIVGEFYYGIIVIENCVNGGRIMNSKQASVNNYIGSVVGY